jgi:RimJ/RimL family protein N-acetyltransferase
MGTMVLLFLEVEMLLNCDEIIVRDFERKDAQNIFRIVREKNILRFIPDWAENQKTQEEYYDPIDWYQTQKDSKDVFENKRYVVALLETDELIGMVGMGLEGTINEVEMAYYMSEKYQRKGYTQKALLALAKWCFSVSDIPYMIATIDCANINSCKFSEKCGFELFEKRTPISHKQKNMESDSYYYYRLYRKFLEV